jgi:N,N'-diacetyllegionaminate synthase
MNSQMLKGFLQPDSGGLTVIAEVAQAHDGSLGTAHAYIDAVAAAGADAVKFQTHIAAAESTPSEPWRVKFSAQDQSRFEYWQRMEFSELQWTGLADHARERGLMFLSTPFSLEAVELLERIGVPAWKIGSGDIGNLPLLERVSETGKPIILSSGMSPWDEMDKAVDRVRGLGCDVAVLQCTTSYPCVPEQVGLNVLSELRHRYNCPVGLSDHSGTIFSSLAAVALGAELIEVHVVFDQRCFGPDVKASITIDELATLVKGARFLRRVLDNPVDKDKMANELGELRQMFGRSIVAAGDLQKGHKLTQADLGFKKPGGGLPPAQWRSVMGRLLRRSLARDEPIEEGDLD